MSSNYMRLALAATLLASVLPGGRAAAQDKGAVQDKPAAPMPGGGPLPAALKDIAPASGVCRRDAPAGAASAPPAPAIAPDLGCAMPVAAVQEWLAQPGALLADLRSAGDFQGHHIEAAVNLTSLDLRSKPYWRAKPVVLAGDGKGEQELYSLCAQLKQQGYQRIGVLRGGVPAWQGSGQPLAGRAPPLPLQLRLSPEELWQEAQNADNMVLLLPDLAALQKHLPFAAALAQPSAAAVKAVAERRRKETRNAPLASVVVAGASLSDRDIERLQRELSPVPVLAYTGALAAFQHQLTVQKAVWTAQARGPRQPACGQ